MKKTPFSNGSEYTYFQEQNCLQCISYECESTKIEDAGCKAAFELDLATVSDGEISIEAYDYIGLGSKDLSQCLNFRHKRSWNEEFPPKKPVDPVPNNQLCLTFIMDEIIGVKKLETIEI